MPIEPSGQHLEQLTTALLNAFSHDELTRLVRAQFDQDLEWITPVAGKRDLTTITSDLVTYFASQEGGLKKLLGAAVRENPLNTDLSALVTQWSELDFVPRPLPDVHPNNSELISNSTTTINTGGGTYIGGSVDTGGGDFVGRDKVTQGDTVHGDKKVGGDKVAGDKIVANIGDNNSGIAIGKDITQTTTITHGVDPAQLNALFSGLLQAATTDKQTQATDKQTEAVQVVADLQAEAAKGDQAEDRRMATLIDDFVDLVPTGVSAVVSAFASPILAGVVGPVTRYALDRLKGK